MFLLFLKDLSLFFGSVFLLYVLMGLFMMSLTSNTSVQRGPAQQDDAFGCFIQVGFFMLLLRILVWPIDRLFSKKDAWWAHGWWPLFSYAVLGMCLLLVGWFL